MLVGAYSWQAVFHCDLHSYQENSQPETPPTYSLTLTSHLHFIMPPPPHIQSNGKLSPHNTFRDTKRIHEGHSTMAYNTTTPGKHPLTRVEQNKTNKQKHPLTKKCSKANHYSHILMFPILHAH